jgi:hypothetical protein
MAIVSSEIYQILEQPNGIAHIYERHTDTQGVVYSNCYTLPAGIARDSRLAVNATELAESLANQEFGVLLNG